MVGSGHEASRDSLQRDKLQSRLTDESRGPRGTNGPTTHELEVNDTLTVPKVPG